MRTIENERTGDIPADLSEQASVIRRKRTNTADCASAEVPEAWEHFASATLAEKCARLATVEGKDAEFCHSLAKQFADKGTLSPKQTAWAENLYRKYAEANYWHRLRLLNHDWNIVGTITHYYQTVLGTYSATDYHKCAKCGEWGETYHENNYSGD